jgi:hypothetical protein
MIGLNNICLGLVVLLPIGGVAAAGPPCAASGEFQAVDFSFPVTEARASANRPALDALKQFGVRTVFRYYDHPNESLACKTLLKDESDAIIAKGLSVAVVFQHNNDDPETFFDKARGNADATRALALADANGQPYGSAIYFGVDGVDQVMNDVVYEYRISGGRPMTEARKQELTRKGDRKHIRHYERFLKYKDEVFNVPVDRLGPDSMLPFVQRYFTDIDRVFRQAAATNPGKGTYEIGGYGSGLVCDFLLSKKLVRYCWLAQSTGWPQYRKFKDTGPWSLAQELPTSCTDWKNQREPSRPVQFDFNRVNAARPSFGQWSAKRNPASAIDRPVTCPAL